MASGRGEFRCEGEWDLFQNDLATADDRHLAYYRNMCSHRLTLRNTPEEIERYSKRLAECERELRIRAIPI